MNGKLNWRRCVQERPLVFTGESIPLILSRQKTQTRRVVTRTNSLVDGYPATQKVWDQLQFDRAWIDPGPSPAGNPGPYLKVPRRWREDIDVFDETVHRVYSRFCQADQFWVRETWHCDGDYKDPDIRARHEDALENMAVIFYKATDGRDNPDAGWIWKPSIFMPRWASRADLLNKGVRVQRIQECIDFEAEGVVYRSPEENIKLGWPHDGPNWFAAGTGHYTPGEAMRALWNSVNAKRGYPWESNSYVWIIDFELIDKSS